MLPIGGGEALSPPAQRPHLVARLQAGWGFDPDTRTFHSETGEVISPTDDLPEGSEIVFMVPELAKASPEELSPARQKLASFLHVLLPEDSKPEDYLSAVKKWECLAEAHLPPEVSLPGSDPSQLP